MPHETVIRLGGIIRGISLTPPPERRPRDNRSPEPVPPPAEPPALPVLPAVDPEERAAAERVLKGLGRLAEEVRKQQQGWLEEARKTAIKLGMAIASHLLHERLATGDFAIEAVVEKVVARLNSQQAVTIYLHPDDITLLERRLGDRPLAASSGTDLRFASDPRLQRGSCRAESGDVTVLWQMEDQLAQLAPRLLGCLTPEDAAPEPVLLRASG